MNLIDDNHLEIEYNVAYGLATGVGLDGWEILEFNVYGEWRWGVVYRVVAQKPGVLGIWSYENRVKDDGSYASIDYEGPMVTFLRVVPEIVTVVNYVYPAELA